MKDLYISDLRPSDDQATFQAAVVDRQVREKKNGSAYLHLVLGDKTGTIDTKMWDDIQEAEGIVQDDVVKVQGLVGSYKDKPQFTIKRIRKATDDEIDDRDYLPASPNDPEEVFDRICHWVETMIKNQELSDTILSMLHANEREFKAAPAAMKLHHAWVGGLMDHVDSLLNLSIGIKNRYPHLDMDLLVAACVLHDFGKIKELAMKRSFSYSTQGQLIGHVAIGLQMFDTAARETGLDEKTSMLVKHTILSHHGILEHGALKVPMFPEAIAFHYIDELDARIEIARKAIDEADAKLEFAPYTNSLSTQLYRRSNEDTANEAGG